MKEAISYNKKLELPEAYWRRVQTLLNSHDMTYSLVIDGKVGGDTTGALWSYQVDVKIEGTGKLNPETIGTFCDPSLYLMGLTESNDRHPVCEIVDAYPKRALVLDVSKHQKEIDWAAVKKAGVAGAIIKTTEGRTYQDPRARENIRGALDAGLKVGVYHYSHIGWKGKITDPLSQVENLLAEIKAAGASPCDLSLGIWLDLETKEVAEAVGIAGAKRTVDWIIDAATSVESKAGIKPGLYLSRRAITEELGTEGDRLKGFPTWWARYPRMPFPLDERVEPSKHLAGWEWCFWQYSCRGKVDGIDADVDLNLTNG